MKSVSLAGLLASMATCLLIVVNTEGQQNTTAGANLAVQDPLQPADVEVLTRGPIHEAFAQATIRRADANEIIKKRPPEPIKELPAELKLQGDHVVWIPGYWAHDEDRGDFLWVSGTWRAAPPGRVWTPGYWRQAEDGWQWVSGYWAARGETEVALYPAPPDPIPEAMPPMPEGGDYSGGATYIPGNWTYQNDDYWWQPGFWAPNRQGWMWSPSSYSWTPGGYNYRPGFWDYAFDQRGMLFPPVAFQGQPWNQANWTYQPRYGIYNDFLMNSMFARVGTNQYYFGDYFDPRYAQLGYRAWMDYRVGGQFYDPTFAYYRWVNRNNAQWEAQLRATAQARAAGRMPPLPRTLIELQKLVRADAKANIRIIGELDQLQKQVANLEKVNQIQLKQMAEMAKDLDELAKKRAKAEAVARAKVKDKTDPAPVKVKVERAKSLTTVADGAVKAPPAPTQPAVKSSVSVKTDAEAEAKGGKAKGEAKQKGKADADAGVETKGGKTKTEVQQKGKSDVKVTPPPVQVPKTQPPPKIPGGGDGGASSRLERPTISASPLIAARLER